jgi:LysR family transcriptional regulator for bpeEF and oprC
MDRLDAIRLFVRVVECGSFSAVAREVGVGQPAVSKQIAALEAHLGAQLVQRTSRRITITEAGQIFHESAKRLMDDFEAAQALVGKGQASPSGLVRLSAAPLLARLYLVPLLPRFFDRYPDVSVELSASERHVDLIGEGIDLALRHGPLPDSSLTARAVATSPFVTVATPDYLGRHGTPTTPAELEGHACVVFAAMNEVRPWHFQVEGEGVVHYPRGRFRTADAEQVRAAVLAGLGMAHGPRWLFGGELACGQVKAVLNEFQTPPLQISLVHAAGRRPPARVRALMDFIIHELPRNEFLR